MRFLLAAIGRLKEDSEAEIIERYVKRLDGLGRGIGLGPLKIIELPESRAASSAQRKSDEAKRLLDTARDAEVRIVLDEKGKVLTSEAFAAWLSAKRDGGTKQLALLIGGPDGHGAAVLDGATLRLSLSAMTLPHGLARVVLAEQLYRATTLLAGHPYHRV